MFSAGLIKKAALVTLIFFTFIVLNESIAFSQNEDMLDAAKRYLQQGDYSAAENSLKEFIHKTQTASGQKHKLAEAHYLLAKLYFIVSESDEKIDENIRKAFKIYKDFKPNEENMFFGERVKKITDTVGMITGPPKKTKKKFPILLVVGGAIVVTALVILLSKKKSKKYTLTVALDGGVEGNPAAGTYTYKKGESVNYNFSRKSGYRDLVVILDGSPAPSSGNIIMDRDHSLTASTTKIGRINSISVKFTVRFAATNLKVRHRVWIDNSLKIDEILNFRVHSSDKWEDAVKIYRNFTVNCGTNLIRIQQEAGPYYTNSYSRDDCYWIWGTYYELEIIDYTYIDGVDPGWPTLSEGWFYLNVAPWRNDPTEEWYRIKVKEITINPPSVTGKKQSKEMANQKLKGESNR